MPSPGASADGLTYEFVLRGGVRFAGGGRFTYGAYPDIEGLIREQATELDRGKRDAILHGIAGYGPRVAESAIGLITSMAASAPYEELRLKGK